MMTEGYDMGAQGKGRVSVSGNRTGFSLMELVVALGVLMTGVIGVTQMYAFGIAKTRAINESSVARTIIDTELERLHAMPFDALASMPVPVESLEASGLVQAIGMVDITPRTGQSTRLKEATISLRWIGDNGRVVSRKVTTLIADMGGAR